MIRNCIYLVLLSACTTYMSTAQNAALSITSTSSNTYQKTPATAIYPAFVDGIQYQSWTSKGALTYFQLTAKGGVPPYKWKLMSGSLPTGIKMNSSGQLSGLPTKQGTFNFVVKVTDNRGESTSKKLSFQALAYRSKWLSDANFGIMVQWGPFVPPSLSTKEQLEQFEKRITKFDADKWAQTVADLGGKVLNFTAKAGDGIRLWPSKTPSKYNLATNRNIVGELVAACHRRGIKFVAYIAPDHGWNKVIQDVGQDGSLGTLNVGIIGELLDMGVDGFWIDMGGTPELHPNVDPKWFPWDKIIPLIRTKNPGAIFVSNPGLGQGGTILKWPNTDVAVYEGRMAADEYAFVTAKPVSVKKKIAIEVDNLLDSQWAWNFNAKAPQQPKTAEMIINNIRANWKVGATYMLNYPVPADGNILPEIYAPILKDVAKFVRGNAGNNNAPIASLSPDSVYRTSQTLRFKLPANGSIYYTTDGTDPSSKSLRYTGPIKITKTTIIRAVQIAPGRPQSRELSATYRLSSATKSSTRSARALPENVSAKPDSMNYYRGMRITVGRRPILLERVGRKYIQNNKGNHTLIIKRYSDDISILTEDLNTASAKVESNGYQYPDMPAVRLEAGKSYIIAFRENSKDKFAYSIFREKPKMPEGLSFVERFILSPSGDRTPVKDDQIGQLIDIAFKPTGETSSNLALGAQAAFLDNADKPLKPIRGVFYPENAIDGDKKTIAVAGGRYVWTLSIDLMHVEQAITKVELMFDKPAPTDFTVFMSEDARNWKPTVNAKNNTDTNPTFTFPATNARYIKVRSTKPDAPGQAGGVMSIVEFKISK